MFVVFTFSERLVSGTDLFFVHSEGAHFIVCNLIFVTQPRAGIRAMTAPVLLGQGIESTLSARPKARSSCANVIDVRHAQSSSCEVQKRSAISTLDPTLPFVAFGESSPRPQDSITSRTYLGSMLTRTNSQHGIMLTAHRVLFLGSLLLCLFLLRRIQQAKRASQAFGSLPAYTSLIAPLTTFSRILPRIPWISDGAGFGWKNAYNRQVFLGVQSSYPTYDPCLGIFVTLKSDIVQTRSLLPYGTPQLLLADAAAIKVGPL